MSETDPGFSDHHAGYVGARRATVGEPTDRESMNVPQTRPGAAENAHEAELAREGHETFIPESPVRDEREDAAEHSRTEEKSLRGSRGGRERRTSSRMSTQGEAVPVRGDGHGRTTEREASGRRSPPMTEDDLRREIEETRRELGATVGALMAKANVKNWAGHAAGRARARARNRAGHAREVARERAEHAAEVARERAEHAAEVARERAAGAAGVVKGRASHMADVAIKAREGVPEHVKDAAAGARRRPALLVVMVAAGAASVFALRQMMRQRSMPARRTTLGRTVFHLSMTGRMPPRRTPFGQAVLGRALPSRTPPRGTLASRTFTRRSLMGRTLPSRSLMGRTLLRRTEPRRSMERGIEPYRSALRQAMATRSMPGRSLSERTALSESVARRVMPARTALSESVARRVKPSRTARGRSMSFLTRTRRPMARRRLVEVGRHRDRIRIVIRLP
ncbi:DUF3618 domain-containing protein [Nonomuraea fastidiosa]|uniref:DUF3618 domain-containing protein n=1 Tax=Nonomuraea fastidiosa TaxID=46173 RepID=UPI00366E364F